jgi:hypothetical protein
VPKPSEDRAVVSESRVGIEWEKKSLGAEPLEKQGQVAKSQGASMLRKGLGVTTQFGSSMGAGQHMEVIPGGTVCGGNLAHKWLSSSWKVPMLPTPL